MKRKTNSPPTLASKLQDIVGPTNILSAPGEVWAYGYDNSRKHALAEAVVFPQSHQHVVAIVKLCNELNKPLIARGRGTGTTGATVPVRGGVILSTERMPATIEIDCDNRMAIVSPGVTNQAVQDAAKQFGFFWAPDPTSAAFCSVGGNLAYNSAGPRAVKYGTTRENVLGLRAVTGEGEELRTGTYTTKGVVGYDFTRLLIGSEGTLAIFTEATLKLTPLAEEKYIVQVVYQDIHSAAKAVSAIMAQPVTPCALEFIDGAAIEMVRNYAKTNLPKNAGAMLMIEVDGPKAGLDDALQKVIAAARNDGVQSIEQAKTKQEIENLWATRKALSPALRNVAPKKINEDVVVPVSRIPELIDGLEKLSKQHNVKIVNFGHAGNGNIHVNLLIDPDDPVQLNSAHHCLDDVFNLVLALKGTLSGEHGVGMEKQAFVDRELDPVSLSLMRKIKRLFDPNNILNPDKMFPLE